MSALGEERPLVCYVRPGAGNGRRDVMKPTIRTLVLLTAGVSLAASPSVASASIAGQIKSAMAMAGEGGGGPLSGVFHGLMQTIGQALSGPARSQ